MPVWPGDPAVSLETVCTAETDGCRITRLTLGSHTGTHLDAPRHVLPGGSSLDELPEMPDLGGEGQMRLSEDGRVVDPEAAAMGPDAPEELEEAPEE